jgi:hypothetical protein
MSVDANINVAATTTTRVWLARGRVRTVTTVAFAPGKRR